MIVLRSVPLAERPSIIRAKTPLSLHRYQRLQSVFAGPYSCGASRHLNPWRPPPQRIAIDENNAAQHATIIHSWSAMAYGKERLKPSHLLVRQPEKIAHHSGSCRQPESQSSLKIDGS
jgi:hypothetical protein